MFIDETHPNYADIIVLDPQGNTVRSVLSLDTVTARGTRYATDAAGHVLFETTIAGSTERRVRRESCTLYGHRVMFRGGALIADLPSAPTAPRS
jgi:hypothetical protein